MTRPALLLALLLAACGGPESAPAPLAPPQPGGSVSLADALSAALGCPAADLTWTALDGGTVTSTGAYTAPACGAAVFPATFHVEARGCGKAATAEIPVQEALLSLRLCPGAAVMAPGETRQWYALATYSCPGHVEWSPPPPPAGACPAP